MSNKIIETYKNYLEIEIPEKYIIFVKSIRVQILVHLDIKILIVLKCRASGPCEMKIHWIKLWLILAYLVDNFFRKFIAPISFW